MTNHRRPTRQARTILVDAHTLATLIDPALTNLDLGLAGWPESTPGASPAGPAPLIECHHPECSQTSPCPTHDADEHPDLYGATAVVDATGHVTGEWGHQPAENTTATERLAQSHDKASVDQAALIDAVAAAAHHMRIAAAIANRWAYGGVDATTVKARLVAIDSEIWCANCSRYGRHEPRKKDRSECDFCDGFRERRFKRSTGGIWQAPPKEIWDARDARNGSLDETTIIRILKRVEIDRREAAAAARAKQRAESEAKRQAESEAS